MKQFYQKGVDITNAKECFNFLSSHFTYPTLNSWNGLRSIANNVKIYKLGLEGDAWQALNFLRDDDYFTVNMRIEDWEAEHKGYAVGFNGSSGGYLVLYNKDNNRNILPDEIADYETYESFKENIRYEYGSVKSYMSDLVFYVKLVQDFDKLCDELTAYVNSLSKLNFKTETMKERLERFNDSYAEELSALNIADLQVIEDKIDVSGLTKSLLDCLYTFLDLRTFGINIQLHKIDNKTFLSYLE